MRVRAEAVEEKKLPRRTNRQKNTHREAKDIIRGGNEHLDVNITDVQEHVLDKEEGSVGQDKKEGEVDGSEPTEDEEAQVGLNTKSNSSLERTMKLHKWLRARNMKQLNLLHTHGKTYLASNGPVLRLPRSAVDAAEGALKTQKVSGTNIGASWESGEPPMSHEGDGHDSNGVTENIKLNADDYELTAMASLTGFTRLPSISISKIYTVFSTQSDANFKQLFKHFTLTAITSQFPDLVCSDKQRTDSSSKAAIPNNLVTIHAKRIHNNGTATYRSPSWFKGIHQQGDFWVDVVMANLVQSLTTSTSRHLPVYPSHETHEPHFAHLYGNTSTSTPHSLTPTSYFNSSSGSSAPSLPQFAQPIAVLCADSDVQFFPGWREKVTQCLQNNDI
eukprot:GHVQ01033297.1.p1 GENE.GHVQ01033297.1~~GHVQ01033297.1.p1  ORF type:complete len:389 (-),score=57.53 GHVQ01033297.1:4260-5426(-)